MWSWALKRVSGHNRQVRVWGKMMASLYKKYLMERTDDCVIENAFGFATYRYVNNGKSVYIIDIFIIPELRKNGEAANMADAIVKEAKEKGCTELIGSVVPSMKGSTTSMKVLLAYGMTVSSCSNDFIIFKKEI